MPPSKPPSRTKTLRSNSGTGRSSGPRAKGASRGGTARKGTSRGKNPRTRKAMTAVAVLLAAALVTLGVVVGVLDAYGQKNRVRRADAIVVLGARVREDGQAGQGLQMRVLHAVRLYKKGVAPKIITTGGVGDHPPAEAEVAARLAMRNGVPHSDILVENKSTSTWENATYAAAICKQRGWKSVVLVSDPFHLWRAQRNFARNGVRGYPSPVAVAMWREQPLRKAFWTTREALLVARDWVLRRV